MSADQFLAVAFVASVSIAVIAAPFVLAIRGYIEDRRTGYSLGGSNYLLVACGVLAFFWIGLTGLNLIHQILR